MAEYENGSDLQMTFAPSSGRLKLTNFSRELGELHLNSDQAGFYKSVFAKPGLCYVCRGMSLQNGAIRPLFSITV